NPPRGFSNRPGGFSNRSGGFSNRLGGSEDPPHVLRRYRVVTQLLNDPALEEIDTARLRARVRAFAAMLDDPETRPEDLDAATLAITGEAQRIIDARKAVIA